MLRVQGQEFLDRYKRQLPVAMAVSGVSTHCQQQMERTRGADSLVALAGRDLPLQVPLLIVQVLQLQVQPVQLALRLGRLSLRLTRGEAGRTVKAAQPREVCKQHLLLSRRLAPQRGLVIRCRLQAVISGRCGRGAAAILGLLVRREREHQVNHRERLLPCLRRDLQQRAQERVRHRHAAGRRSSVGEWRGIGVHHLVLCMLCQ